MLLAKRQTKESISTRLSLFVGLKLVCPLTLIFWHRKTIKKNHVFQGAAHFKKCLHCTFQNYLRLLSLPPGAKIVRLSMTHPAFRRSLRAENQRLIQYFRIQICRNVELNSFNGFPTPSPFITFNQNSSVRICLHD